MAQDGTIDATLEAVPEWRRELAKELFELLDLDGSGALSKQDLVNHVPKAQPAEGDAKDRAVTKVCSETKILAQPLGSLPLSRFALSLFFYLSPSLLFLFSLSVPPPLRVKRAVTE